MGGGSIPPRPHPHGDCRIAAHRDGAGRRPYFTLRAAQWELEEYGRELVAAADYMRPNFFLNTPDILHASLQHGGPPMFRIRAVLAALMSRSWGVYSGRRRTHLRPSRGPAGHVFSGYSCHEQVVVRRLVVADLPIL